MLRTLTAAQARRIALAAQGFGVPRPQRPATMRDVQQIIDTVAQFQIDSINVVARAHYLPLFSRLGAYPRELLDRASHRKPRRLFEYWGHAASLIDVRLQPALRFRMAGAADEAWGSMRRISQERPDLVERVYRDVRDRGPVTSRDIEQTERSAREHWGWNWSEVKTAMEWLFWSGRISSTGRNSRFERVFDLPERVLAAQLIAAPTPPVEHAIDTLVRRAAAALGVGSLGCFADYFRIPAGLAKPAVDRLVDTGELLPVRVAGWSKPAWLWHRARIPRRIDAAALVSPFDSMVFERARLRALFGFDYRIEIYVPQPKRRYGYYVYPFLLGDRFVARVDLKADRAAGVLRVLGAWLEPGSDPDRVAAALTAELAELAGWLDLTEVAVNPLGDLAAQLATRAGERLRPITPLPVPWGGEGSPGMPPSPLNQP